MKRITKHIIAAALVLIAQGTSAADTLTLLIGEQRIYPGEGVEKVSVGSEAVANVRISQDQSQVVVTAIREGRTSLNLWMGDGRQISRIIEVMAQDPDRIRRDLQELLPGIEGLEIKTVGSRVLLEGLVDEPQDLARIKTVSGLFAGQVLDFTRLQDGAFNPKEMIQLEFTFLEIDHQDGYQLGINWPDGIGADGAGITFEYTRDYIKPNDQDYQVITTTNTEGTLDVKIGPTMGFDFAANEGAIRVLDVHKVAVRNGEEAAYNAGGQVNVIIRGVNDSKLEKVQYGTALSVTPAIDRFGRIQIAINADVSELDAQTSFEGVPGLLKRMVNTKVDLREGESLALTGLTRSVKHDTEEGVPGLMDIPIIGWLFKSKGEREMMTDGVIFITPRILKVQSAENHDLINGMKSRVGQGE